MLILISFFFTHFFYEFNRLKTRSQRNIWEKYSPNFSLFCDFPYIPRPKYSQCTKCIYTTHIMWISKIRFFSLFFHLPSIWWLVGRGRSTHILKGCGFNPHKDTVHLGRNYRNFCNSMGALDILESPLWSLLETIDRIYFLRLLKLRWQ